MATADNPTPARRTEASRRVAVVGAGSWGTALAVQFARAGRESLLWGREQDDIPAIAAARENRRYLPGVAFPDKLEALPSLAEALGRAEEVVVAVPSHAFRATLERIRASGVGLSRIAWATKGFEADSGLLPHQVVAEVLGEELATAVLSGPTFAREVGAGLPSAIVVASREEDFALSLARTISSEVFRAYPSGDIIGVEVGGATKNVLAIGAGIADGLGFGANTRAALVTRGLVEMTRLGASLGAQRETFMGLSGLGDLMLTCTDDQSRNRRFGLALAAGTDIETARGEIGQVVEGYFAARAVHRVASRLEVEMPIAEEIYEVIYEGRDLHTAVSELMRRPITPE